jgi:hypothetical protein
MDVCVCVYVCVCVCMCVCACVCLSVWMRTLGTLAVSAGEELDDRRRVTSSHSAVTAPTPTASSRAGLPTRVSTTAARA